MAVVTHKPDENNGDDTGKIPELEDDFVITDKDGNKLHFVPVEWDKT